MLIFIGFNLVTRELYPKLAEKLDRNSAIPLSLSLGPKGIFYMQRSREQDSNLPAELKRALKAYPPQQIELLAMGCDNSFVLQCKDGSQLWALRNSYGALEDLLNSSKSTLKVTTRDLSDSDND